MALLYFQVFRITIFRNRLLWILLRICQTSHRILNMIMPFPILNCFRMLYLFLPVLRMYVFFLLRSLPVSIFRLLLFLLPIYLHYLLRCPMFQALQVYWTSLYSLFVNAGMSMPVQKHIFDLTSCQALLQY